MAISFDPQRRPRRAPEPAPTPGAPTREAPAPGPGGGPRLVRRPRRTRRALLLWAFVLVAVLAGGAYWTWWRAGAASQQAFVTVPVSRGDIEDSITALGNLQPRDYVDVGTQVSGQLRAIYFEVGDAVEKGDLLAEIDPAVFEARVEADRAQLRSLEAQLAERQAQRRLAQQQLQRQAGLLQANATSEEAYQSAEAALKIAEAQIESLQAQIAQTESTLRGNEANLSYTQIYAPMSGTVVSVSARQGQTLNANQQAPIVLRIADLDTMTVWTQVSEADVTRLSVGMDVYFTTLGQPDRRWRSTLKQILPTPEVVNNVVLYNALFDVENPDHALRTQMTAQVFFVRAAATDVLTVPLAALSPTPQPAKGAEAPADKSTARVLVGNRVEEREVTVGIRNRVAAEVLAGLAEGEQVIVGTRQPAEPAAAQRPSSRPRL